MKSEEILNEAAKINGELIEIRRKIHRRPEVGFETKETGKLVRDKLTEYGYSPEDVGKAGIVATVGGGDGKTILLRADMDALPIEEEAESEFKSEVRGKMHGCGHDMHTAMLLGAAKLLKEHEKELRGRVKIEFQSAEEIFQGSVDMLENGLLDNPKVDAAAMIHVVAGSPLPSGSVLISGGGIANTSCEQYHITVKGKGGHGSTPHESVDPITAAAHIHIALCEINARELAPDDFGVFTTGRFEAGKASNVIPDAAEMWGTIRTTDSSGKVGDFIKKRIREISAAVGSAFRTEVSVEFYDFCPCMTVDEALSKSALKYMKELLGERAIDLSVLSGGKAGGGSEDFAFVSRKVPSLAMYLVAGSASDGYAFGQHHPKVRFDDSVLYVGTAAFAYTAFRYLEDGCI